MKKFAPIVSFLLLPILLFNGAAPAVACGPSFVEPVFDFEQRAESFDKFARGELGVVQPRHYRSFLFAAYRYFNNQPFTPGEQTDLVAVWKSEFENEDVTEKNTNEAVRRWIAARKRVLPGEAEPKIYTAREYDGGYEFFPNCTANAFEIAAKTLESRAAQHGATDENVKNWARAQDTVFGNCSEGKQVPPGAEPTAPAWLKNDREYQIAAANFYATNFDAAKTGFVKIAAARESPWSALAAYLVARTLIRQASLVEDEDPAQREANRKPFYVEAEKQLRAVAADPNRGEFHEPARKMLNLVAYRLRPAERRRELAAALLNRGENQNLRLDLIDYKWLLDKSVERARVKGEAAEQEAAQKAGKEYDYDYKVKFSDISADERADDLTDWIFTFQSPASREALAHSLERLKATNNSTHWLVAALAQADRSAPEAAQLIAAAERVEPASPAFSTAAYHQIRLLIETGKQADAKTKLDRILSDRNLKLPVSAQNLFAAERLKLAANLDEFLQFAQRRAAAFAYDGAPYLVEDITQKPKDGEDYWKDERLWTNRTMFDEDSVGVFNEQMPLSLLQQSFNHPKLPDYLKRNVLIAAWTRAVLLDRDQAAQDAAAKLAPIAPEFKIVFSRYLSAQTAAERQAEATYLLLKTPALRPFVESGYGRLEPIGELDSYRDNWWCAPTDTYTDSDGKQKPGEKARRIAFLTDAQLAEAEREREQIKKGGNSSTFLARRAVDFATAAPNDARLAESLHLAVRATRYGCQDCDTGRYSKQAHDILKRRFPTSEWAKKTPYWFKDESCEQK